MELASIEKLLEKYLEATTSIAEENILREYFLSDKVAPHLQQYQPLFGYFAASRDERFTKTIQLKSQKRNWKWLSLAASVVLLVSVYSGYDNYQDRLEAERVYAETKQALTMLSANLNKGSVAIAQLQHFEDTKNKIFKQTK